MRHSVVVVVLAAAAVAGAAQPSPQPFDALRWRLIGPPRAGRAWAVTGVPGEPAVYFLGTPAGALWKSTNGGTTWQSVSDTLPVTGIGAIAVAPSNPRIVYVGTGSNTLGNGVYRSADGGRTWQHAGLDDTKYLAALLVDPQDPDTVLAGAGPGGNFGTMVFYNNNPTPARGLYRTADGGRTWTHTLFVDATSGVIDMVWDPSRPRMVYASLTAGTSRGAQPIYRSLDEGRTWERLETQGLPASGAANIAVAPGTEGRRLYALVGGRGTGGLFRSDDGGSTWTLMTTHLASAGGHLYVDPSDPDVVYTMGTSVYRSTDGGRTLEAIKGAPGGDDPHAMWIDPANPRRMIVGADQGPTISVDGGRTWTPWYTVPNGELYFVSTDGRFPYRVYAAQQDSGTVSILSRSDFGAIRPNDWYPVSGYEQGHIFSDPLDPRYVYTHGNGHDITRFDRDTGQSGPVYTPAREDRFGPRPGMDLSAKDPHWMFVGAQWVLASSDRVTWTRISPDLTAREDQTASGGRPGTGTIVALAASPLDLDVLWAATSNGIIQVTRDRGRLWTNVSPPRLDAEPALTLWSMEASRHEASTAYAAAIDLSDRHAPCLFMTTDYGRTWRTIGDGLPPDVPTRVVREDPVDRNLLYAGTQAGAYVSFDRGAHWQSLQLNLPRITVNDITVHDADLVIATWGRGLWILDDVAPLRQAAEAAGSRGTFLFAPSPAIRARWDVNQDTPLPPEVLTGENPPEGAIIDYLLPGATTGTASIAILDDRGSVVRQFSNATPPPDTRMPNVPDSWFAAPAAVDASPGAHRFVWDLRYPTPPPLDYGPDGNPSSAVSYGIIAPAILGRSPRQQPLGPLALPGTYHVRLAANGTTLTRDLVVRNDPRSAASLDDLRAQLTVQLGLAGAIARLHDAIEQVRSIRNDVRQAAAGASGEARAAAETFDRAAAAAIAAMAGNRSLGQRLAALDYADLRPTPSTLAAVREACARADDALGTYRTLRETDLATLDAALTAAGFKAVNPPPAVPVGTVCGR